MAFSFTAVLTDHFFLYFLNPLKSWRFLSSSIHSFENVGRFSMNISSANVAAFASMNSVDTARLRA